MKVHIAILLEFCVLITVFWTQNVLAQSLSGLVDGQSKPIPFDFAGKPLPAWNRGALIAISNHLSKNPELHVFDRSGANVDGFPLAIPGVSRINVYSGMISRHDDGTLAVAGSAYSEDSRGATFIAFIAPDRREQTIVRTSPFASYAITFASDGTLWAIGPELVDGKLNDAPIIRRFDRFGKNAGSSAVDWSALGLQSRSADRLMMSRLLPARDRVGWYAERARIYVEFALDGTELARFTIPEFVEGDKGGEAVLCDNGTLYVGVRSNTATRSQQVELRALDRRSGTWRTVPTALNSGAYLLGCEDNKLVVMYGWRTIAFVSPN